MILLFGGAGSIGKRYQAVLKGLGEPFRVIELGDRINWDEAKKIVIATPTHTHFSLCLEASYRNIPFLCEKPLSKDLKECEEIVQKTKNGYVVNNYAFIGTNQPLQSTLLAGPISLRNLTYDFFNTGRDGTIWDVCQLVYLAHLTGAHLRVSRESFYWHFEWNDYEVPYQWIEYSYLQMMNSFLRGETSRLWKMSDGCKMTEICHELEQKLEGRPCEGFDWNPGTHEFSATAG